MADVFISYARADSEWIEPLSRALVRAGYSVWWDRELVGGARFQQEIEAQLEAARAIIVLWSRSSSTSHWVADEAEFARVRGRLIPISLDGSPPPLGFRQFQVIDFSAWNRDDGPPLPRLLDTLSRLAPASTPPDADAPCAAESGKVLQRPAVAIMPFQNMSGDPAQEYFADGITEDLITALSAWRWFPVIARNSTFVYKGRAVDVTRVGRDLGVRYLLEGSVRRAGERLRISAQLIEASTAHHIWAQTYDRRIGDVFELQDEITRAIVGAIEPQLTRAEQNRAARKLPANLDAWDLSLQALAQIRTGTSATLHEAERLLLQALQQDPTSSYAQSLLALARFQRALFGWSSDPRGSLLSTYEAALRAVELDDNDWQAHALLGIATLWSHSAYERATSEVERAIAINPSAAMAYHFAGCVLTYNDKPGEALPMLQAVLKLDPRFQLLPTTLADIGLVYLLTGDYACAVEYCERALVEQRDHLRALQRLAAAKAYLGRLEEASASFARVLKLQPQFSRAYLEATYPFRNPEHSRLLEDGLRRAGWNG